MWGVQNALAESFEKFIRPVKKRANIYVRIVCMYMCAMCNRSLSHVCHRRRRREVNESEDDKRMCIRGRFGRMLLLLLLLKKKKYTQNIIKEIWNDGRRRAKQLKCTQNCTKFICVQQRRKIATRTTDRSTTERTNEKKKTCRRSSVRLVERFYANNCKAQATLFYTTHNRSKAMEFYLGHWTDLTRFLRGSILDSRMFHDMHTPSISMIFVRARKHIQRP